MAKYKFNPIVSVNFFIDFIVEKRTIKLKIKNINFFIYLIPKKKKRREEFVFFFHQHYEEKKKKKEINIYIYICIYSSFTNLHRQKKKKKVCDQNNIKNPGFLFFNSKLSFFVLLLPKKYTQRKE